MDVYYDWVDACEAVAKEHADQGGDPDGAPAPRESGTVGLSAKGPARLNRHGASNAAASGSGYTGAEDDDGFVVEDEADAEGDFGADDDY